VTVCKEHVTELSGRLSSTQRRSLQVEATYVTDLWKCSGIGSTCQESKWQPVHRGCEGAINEKLLAHPATRAGPKAFLHSCLSTKAIHTASIFHHLLRQSHVSERRIQAGCPCAREIPRRSWRHQLVYCASVRRQVGHPPPMSYLPRPDEPGKVVAYAAVAERSIKQKCRK
jgi:hypothetical protein